MIYDASMFIPIFLSNRKDCLIEQLTYFLCGSGVLYRSGEDLVAASGAVRRTFSTVAHYY